MDTGKFLRWENLSLMLTAKVLYQAVITSDGSVSFILNCEGPVPVLFSLLFKFEKPPLQFCSLPLQNGEVRIVRIHTSLIVIFLSHYITLRYFSVRLTSQGSHIDAPPHQFIFGKTTLNYLLVTPKRLLIAARSSDHAGRLAFLPKAFCSFYNARV